MKGGICMKKICMLLLAAAVVSQLFAAMIKAGDVLDIKVLSHPEFTGLYAVSENGTIDYPLLADATVANVSTAELMNDLTLRLARHVDNPLVLISIIEHPEISVTVLGEVLKPGPVKTLQNSTLQEAVVLSGGFTPQADLSRVKILRRDRAESPETYNIKQFLTDGTMENMPQLRNGDIVVVLTETQGRMIKVIGAVQKPGLFSLQDTMSIFEVIYMAGGPAEKADLSRVRRLSNNSGKSIEEVLDIQSYIDKGEMDKIPKIAQGDVIIVYSHWFDWKTLLSILNNTLLIIVAIQTFAGVFK